MPAKSAKQEKFMQAVAHSPSFAKKVGVPQSVGREFAKAKGGIMKKSGKAKAMKDMMGRAMAARAARGAMAAPMGMSMGMKKGGSYRKAADGPVVKKGKTKGAQVKMAAGGVAGRPAMTGLNRAAAMSGRTFNKGGMKGCK